MSKQLRLLKKQLAKHSSSSQTAKQASSSSKPSSEQKRALQQRGVKKAAGGKPREKEEIAKRNLQFFVQTKGTQAATTELMNKVSALFRMGAGRAAG